MNQVLMFGFTRNSKHFSLKLKFDILYLNETQTVNLESRGGGAGGAGGAGEGADR